MLEKKLTCQIICNFIDISFSLRYNGRKKVTCYQFSDDLLQLQPEKGGSLVQYIVIIGIMLLISWGVRLLIHRDLKNRQR
jgi:hypothetical protein